ncbi:MAG: extracellular solute-binding protein [Anaerolineae bacterium]|nr:extracellular solute-binding protein [Anaerolineae bacterium]
MKEKSTISRRHFLQLSGAAGATALMGLSLPKRAFAQTEKTINVLTVGDPWDLALQTVVNQFTEQTGIKVNIESLGYVALQARLVNSFLTQTADADVIAVDQMWISQYADNGWIRSLDDFIQADSDTNLTDFLPEVLYSLNTWRNHIWTLPVGAYAQGIMYRTDVFEAAGLDPLPATTAEAADWTWDKYFEMLEQLNGMEMDGTTFYGTTVIGAQPVPVVHMYTQLAASYGARWFTQFPNAPWDFTPTINSPENVAALTDWKKLYSWSPPESINYLWFDAGTRFSQGDIAMFYHWTPYFYLVNNEGYLTGTPSPVVDKFKTAVLPTKLPGAYMSAAATAEPTAEATAEAMAEPGSQQVVSLGGWALGMPSTSENQDEAWQFIKWATGAEGQKAMGMANTKGYQFADFARLSLYEDAELQKIYPFLGTQLEMMRLGNGKVVRPPCPVYTSLEGIYGLNINQVMSEAMEPEAALELTQTLFQNILSGNNMIPYEVESYDDTLENTKLLIESLAGTA